MKIAVFDSGMGGLVVLKELRKKLPQYDYLYLGDTENLPYGHKSQQEIYKLAVKAVDHLFKQNSELVLIACNTVSSEALRKLQQQYLPKSKYKDRKILGIIIPTVESVNPKSKRVGIIGTNRTVDSKAYLSEFKKYHPKTKVFQQNTPLLTPMIEAQNFKALGPVLEHYWKFFADKNIDTLILGCTHYGLIKKQIANKLPNRVKVIAQEDLLPAKVKSYLTKHKEITKNLNQNKKLELQVTKLSPLYKQLTKEWFGGNIKLKEVKY
jgi:glutamate racemase